MVPIGTKVVLSARSRKPTVRSNAARSGKYGMPASRTELQQDLQAVLDRLIVAHRAGHRAVALAFAKCAEELLCSAYPDAAGAISSAASRKGKGSILSGQIVPHMDVSGAAAAVVVLLFRGARQPVVRAI